LEGAKWEYDKNYLDDAEPMKLYYNMPIIHFKPVITEGKSKPKKGVNFYNCPTYVYPVRTGVREKPSYMFTVQLPCKPNMGGVAVDQDVWIKRGTALLMSLED
jgi:dynein heavy chain